MNSHLKLSRKSPKIFLGITLFSLCLASLWSVGQDNQVHQPQGGSSDCSSCHLSSAQKGSQKLFTQNIEALCLRCHSDEEQLSHPVGVQPVKASIPADMPLDWRGKLTCTTCHYAHEQSQSFILSANASHFHLRRYGRGRVFCAACHNQPFSEPMSVVDVDDAFLLDESLTHTGGLSKAHMGVSKRPGQYTTRKSASIVDEVSLECLGCHDSTLASGVHTQVGEGIWDHSQNSTSHPIGVDYQRALMNRPNEYRPASALKSFVQLFDGQVGCGSCHDPYSKERGLLVMSNRDSALCMECHQM